MTREQYERPTIVTFGAVKGLTLGSGGSCCDGANGRAKKLLGNGKCDNGKDDKKFCP
jgi:hypothetical protein